MSADRLGERSWGRLLRVIARLAGPVALAQVSHTFMGLADTLMVGRLGTAAVAGVGIATLVFGAVANALKASEVAVQSIVARRVGERREDEVGTVVATALTVVLSVGVVAMIQGTMWPRFWVSLVLRDEPAVSVGAEYLHWRYLGLLPYLFYFLWRACFDGIGWTRVGMITGIGANVVNLALNWVLIFGHLGFPAMGAAGAALASAIASTVAAVAVAVVALRPQVRRRFRFFARDNLRRDVARRLLSVGWPAGLQSVGLVGGLVAYNVVLGTLGTVAVAAGNIVMRIASVALMPTLGIGIAVQTLVGQALGAGDRRGAMRIGWGGVVCGAIFMSTAGAAFLLWPDALLGAFVDDPALHAAARPILYLTAACQTLGAVGLVLAGALRGAGATRTVMLVDVVTAGAILVPGAWLGGVWLDGGLVGAWLSFLIWFAVHAGVMAWLFQRGRWLLIRI